MADMTAEQLREQFEVTLIAMFGARYSFKTYWQDGEQRYVAEDVNNMRALWDAARLSGMAAVPDGWKLVPLKSTLEMDIAFCEAWFAKQRCIDDPDMDDAYAALLAAAPEVPGHG